MNSSADRGKPAFLQPEFHERIWGSLELEPWFANPVHRTGEAWFREPESTVLVKFLFTTENLSVQVHPDDNLARSHGHPRGKTEMWHILRAQPSARIALGFKDRPTAAEVEAAALDGSIMDMLRWIPVSAGDTWFIPAGAVHAIGAGITLCEVQQNSDVTYRLFDYGRGRDLHIRESLEAMDLEFVPVPIASPAGRVLVHSPFFEVGQIDVSERTELNQPGLGIALAGSGEINGEAFKPGNVWKLEQGQEIRPNGNARFLTVATKT